MTYYSLRLTLPKIFPDLDYPEPGSKIRDISRVQPFIKRLIAVKCDIHSYSCGYECLNKFGEPADPHIHFNFQSNCHKESLRRWITRTFRNIYAGEFSLKGNSMYKLDSYPEPNDWDAWYGYPLKEKPVRTFTRFASPGNGVYEGDDIKERHKIAKALMCVRHQKNREYRAKTMEKQTFYDKLKTYLDGLWLDKDISGQDLDTPTPKQCWLWVLDYYRVCHKPLNIATVDGYVRLYMWESDLLTPESLWSLSSLKK